MPIDPSVFASAGGGIPSHKDALNAFSSLGVNYMNQRYANQVYAKTKKDNLEFWNMQNAYNSPAAQMQRYKDAGLNPHLVYGRGESGNAGPIPTPDTMPVSHREPRFEGSPDLMPALLGAADLKIKQAQYDNLDVQNDLLKQEVVLRGFQAERAGYDLDFERNLTDVSADARRESLRKLKIDNDVTINRDAREAAMNASNVQEAAQRMLSMVESRKREPLERGRIRADTDRIRANIEIMQRDGILKDLEIALRKQGLNPNDPVWMRYVGMFLSEVYEGRLTPTNIGSSIWNWITR